jgi:hypothetical protein
MAKTTIHSRREVLKGLSLGSSALAFAPFLRSLEAHAGTAGGELPQRFVFVVKSSGLGRRNLIPQGVEADLQGGVAYNEADKNRDFSRSELVRTSLANHKLPEILAPFESLKDRMSVVQGLSGKNFTGNHTAGYGALGCMNSEKVPLAPTLDYLLGQRFSQGPYPMYAMAMNGSLLGQNTPPENGYCYPNISAKGKLQPMPFQASPEKAFLELFGNAVMSPQEAKRKLTVKSNLMDFLRQDAKRISSQLNLDERERFGHYTEAFESLRVRETKKASLSQVIKDKAPEFTNLYQSQVETERQQCQFNIATAALITGLSNVVTLRPDTLGTVYTGFGIKATGLHAIGHGREADNGWSAERTRREVDKHHLSLIAKMAQKLDGIPEGDGSMLDNTLIVYTSCAGGSHHAGQEDWPFVLVGGLRKRLKMGQYLQFPTYQKPGHRTIANLYLAIQEAAGIQTNDHFGQPDTVLKDFDISGPLSEILA